MTHPFKPRLESLEARKLLTTLVDFDQDSDLDVIGPGNQTWYENDGRGNFESHDFASVTSTQIAIADVDGDGDLDVMGSSGLWFENTGNADQFAGHRFVRAGVNDPVVEVRSFDLGNDGDADMMIVHRTAQAGKRFAIYENMDGKGDFVHVATHTPSDFGDAISELEAGDINSDGIVDFVTREFERNEDHSVTYRYILHVADEEREYQTITLEVHRVDAFDELTYAPIEHQMVDVDGDGTSDLLLHRTNDHVGYGSVSWRQQESDRVFGNESVLANESFSADGGDVIRDISDADNDGDLDILKYQVSEGTLRTIDFNRAYWVENQEGTGVACDCVVDAILYWSSHMGDLNGDNVIDYVTFEGSKLQWIDGRASTTRGKLEATYQAIQSGSSPVNLDLNRDQIVNGSDFELLMEATDTVYGDVSLNGFFDTSDLVRLFEIGEFEDDIPNNSDWFDGDTNFDGDFDSSDLVKIFQNGGYLQPGLLSGENGRITSVTSDPALPPNELAGLIDGIDDQLVELSRSATRTYSFNLDQAYTLTEFRVIQNADLSVLGTVELKIFDDSGQILSEQQFESTFEAPSFRISVDLGNVQNAKRVDMTVQQSDAGLMHIFEIALKGILAQ